MRASRWRPSRRRHRVEFDYVVGLHLEATAVGGVGREIGQLLATRFDRERAVPGRTNRRRDSLGALGRVLIVVTSQGGRDETEHDDHEDDAVVVARTSLLVRLAAPRRADPTYPFTSCAFSHGGNATKESDRQTSRRGEGTRTLTGGGLSALPLPIGLRPHAKMSRCNRNAYVRAILLEFLDSLTRLVL